MADKKISQLTGATTPLAGTEVLPIVQGGSTVKVSVANLTSGRAVSTGALTTSGKVTINLDGAPGLRMNNTTGGAGQGIEMLTAATKYSWLLGAQYNVNDGFEITPSTAVAGTTFNTPVFQIQYAGGSVFNTTFSTGNLIVGTAGKGIDFSANTHAAGMTSELLDWYEEGTWTPVATWATQGTGTGSFTAYYTRIGNVVTIHINGEAVKGTASGDFKITGVPYAAATAAAAAVRIAGMGSASNYIQANVSTTEIQFLSVPQSTSYGVSVTAAEMNANCYIQVTCTYTV